MLIAVLMIAAAALLVGAFVTGNAVLAGVALVVSVVTAVVYGLSLRRVPADDAGSLASAVTAEDSPDDETTEPAVVATSTEATSTEATSTEATSTEGESTEGGSTAAEEVTAEEAPAEPVPTVVAAEETAPSTTVIDPAPTADPAPTKAPEPKPALATATTVKASTAKASTATVTAPALAGTTVVHVVPGRMRYHVQGCQVIDGQEVEDLTVDDARDEGFTACSRCAALGRTHATA